MLRWDDVLMKFHCLWEQDLLGSREFPDVFYLPIDRPGRLRPDSVRCSLVISVVPRTHSCHVSTPPVIACTSSLALAF